jgi:hypothetical protein
MADLSCSKERAFACVHGAHRNPVVLRTPAAVLAPGAAMLAEY